MRARFGMVAALASSACAAASAPDAGGSTSSATSTRTPRTSAASTSESSGTSADESTTDPTTPSDLPLPPEPKSCALDVIDPDADPALVIDAGDGVGQIPTVIGDVLLRNCGCHYNTNELMPGSGYIDYQSDDQPMATWADFHGNFMGTFPAEFESMPAYVAVERRVVFSDPLPMPPYGCGAQGEDAQDGDKISAADLALLTDWLAANAPDGATYPGE